MGSTRWGVVKSIYAASTNALDVLAGMVSREILILHIQKLFYRLFYIMAIADRAGGSVK